MSRLDPLKDKSFEDFEQDAYLRDIVERNLEITAQCCIDICNRIISLEKAKKPVDYHDTIIRMGELNVLPTKFAKSLVPIAGFRNILIHEYLVVDWDEVYKKLQQLDDLYYFTDLIRTWLRRKVK